MKRTVFSLLAGCVFAACQMPERRCQDFKDGTFSFTTELDGKQVTTTFERKGDREIDYFEGKQDTASIRWINDCEYIVRKLNPVDAAENKAIHMKILSTTDSSYTFEYGVVGEQIKSKGTAIKIN